MQLSGVEQRVLGVLIEKALSQPASYPLTLNAVRVGCNQRSNRHPVMELEEGEVVEALESLRSKGLTSVVIRETGRTERWEHRASERWGLSEKQLAVLAELLLRGPQTEGQLRAHAARLRPFSGLEELQETVRSLVERGEPLVVTMEKQPGLRGIRYRHTLYKEGQVPVPATREEAAAPSGALAELTARLEALEKEVASLREEVRALRGQSGGT